MVSAIGSLDPERLRKIPPRFHAQHEFCFHIHDSMLSMFLEVAETRYPTVKLDFSSEEEVAAFRDASDPITYFLENGRRELAKELSVGQAMMATFSDFFNFLYEGLVALEKRKFVVSYALLRKPFKENLLLLTMMLTDDEKFFSGLEASPAENFGHPGIQDTHRLSAFEAAKDLIPFADFVDPKILHDTIFDVGFAGGLAPLFDKATHLVTNRKQIRTEDLNLNFIFKNPADNDVYENVYRSLSYILLYSMLLQIELFRKAGFKSESLSRWFSLTGLGTFSALFGQRKCEIRKFVNSAMKPFLDCPHCGNKVSVTKYGAARFFTAHKLHCKSCDREHDFPLFWILSKVEWSLESASGRGP
jgi:hypothetical protein